MSRKYDLMSDRAEEFIHALEVHESLLSAKKLSTDKKAVQEILEKAKQQKGLNHREATVLLMNNDEEVTKEIFSLATQIKDAYYGNRVVLFAPLYLSNYCVNSCVYCPYHIKNHSIPRKKMSQEEIKEEVIALQDMGHKRLAIEAGEHPILNPLSYILESINTIYGIHHKSGAIRRVNVNIAATSVENYMRLHEAGIGTYILFQETYDKEAYEQLHPKGPKSDYAYHTEAMDRAMEAGIEDVGLGVLFGLNSYLREFVSILMHAEHLEKLYGAGPHTISVPRLCPADDITVTDFPNSLPDDIFLKIIACLRIAVPYTGMIISTREGEKIRKEALSLGISQISGGSRTSVGGYTHEEAKDTAQFEISDHRSLDEIVQWLMKLGYVPSFCTSCYGNGRVGEDFMKICKSQQIHNFCTPNALLTLEEYLINYASKDTKAIGAELIKEEIAKLSAQRQILLLKRLEEVKKGKVLFY